MKALIIKKYLKDHCRGSILSYFFRLSFPSLAMKAGCDDGSPMNKASARKITNIVIEAFAHWTGEKWRWEQGIQSRGIEGASFPCPSGE